MIKTLQKTLNDNQIEIIKASLYFDIFKYPLTEQELFENSAISISKIDFLNELNKLIENEFLQREETYIVCNGRNKNDILRRIEGNKGAEKIMPTAYQYSKIISSFPFVEGVCLSGGLSKNYYDEEGDIDFFIITKPKRLWICRTLLILRYKLLPKHKKKFWCTNYFISSDNLQIPDINPFTATELAYLIPAINYEVYSKLLTENNWYKKRFPNKLAKTNKDCCESQSSFFKSLVETILAGRVGQGVDSFLLNITLKHWKRKYPELSEQDFELQFRSQKNVCKRHTKGFQNKILTLWKEKQKVFEDSYHVSLEA
jgi:hypothetical protein